MPIPHPSEVRPPGPPRRGGEPWTDDDYDTLVRLCREGLDLTELSQQLGRSPSPVRDRAKRMLPLDQRGVPGDRVLAQLRKNLLADPDYDWAHHLAATPPPRPVINHVLPAPRYAGIPGLEDHQLLVAAEAMAQRRLLDAEDHLAQVLANEVNRRGLADDLRSAAAVNARQRVDNLLDRATYAYDSADYWAMQEPEPVDRSGPRGWAYDEPPW